MGGRAGDLWPSAGLDPGDFQRRVVLGAVVPQELPEEEGEHLGEQQVGHGDPGLVLGDDGHPAGVQVPQAGVEEGYREFHPCHGQPLWGGDEGLLSVMQLDAPGLGGGIEVGDVGLGWGLELTKGLGLNVCVGAVKGEQKGRLQPVGRAKDSPLGLWRPGAVPGCPRAGSKRGAWSCLEAPAPGSTCSWKLSPLELLIFGAP